MNKMFNVLINDCYKCNKSDVLIKCKKCDESFCKDCFQSCSIHIQNLRDSCNKTCADCDLYYKSNDNKFICFNGLVAAIFAGDDRIFIAATELGRLNREYYRKYGNQLTI